MSIIEMYMYHYVSLPGGFNRMLLVPSSSPFIMTSRPKTDAGESSQENMARNHGTNMMLVMVKWIFMLLINDININICYGFNEYEFDPK